MRAAIFIDGAFLEMLIIKEHERAQVDYHKLVVGLIKRVSRGMGQNVDLLRTYYYHALPWAPVDPDEEERERVSKKRGFFHRLEFLPRFTVKLGRTQRVLADDGSVTYQQKGVDVMLAADMVHLAGRGVVDHVILLAPDADYVPAVRLVKEMGVVVHLVHGANVAACAEMRRECDERIELDADFVHQTRRSGNTRRQDQSLEPREEGVSDYFNR